MAKKYTGELAKRLPSNKAKLTAAYLRGDDATFARLTEEEVNAKHRKLQLLMRHFGIEFENKLEEVLYAHYQLSLRLAEAHIPGFQVAERTAGRPKKWTHELRIEAAIALEQLAAQHPNKTNEVLAKLLLAQERWGGLSKTPKALLKQVQLLRNGPYGLNPIVRAAYATRNK